MAEPERVATTTPTPSNQGDPNFINTLFSRRNKDRIDKLLLQTPSLDAHKPPQHSPRRDSGHNHPYRHVSTPNPSRHSKSRSRSRKDSSENISRKKSLEKTYSDPKSDHKSVPEKPQHLNRSGHSPSERDCSNAQEVEQNESMENTKESMEKGDVLKNTTVFHILSKNNFDNNANASSPIDSPDSDGNFTNFKSAENSPLNNTLVNVGEFGSASEKVKYITGIAEQNIDNLIIQSAENAEKRLLELAKDSTDLESMEKNLESMEKTRESMEKALKSMEKTQKSSENELKSLENTKKSKENIFKSLENIHRSSDNENTSSENSSESLGKANTKAQSSGYDFPNFVSAYNTLPLPATVTERILNFRTDAQNITSSEDESMKTRQSNTVVTSDQIRKFTGLKPSGSTGAVAKTTPEQPSKRKRLGQRPTIEEQNNDGPVSMETNDSEGFKTPKKFSTNFVKVLREKAVRSIKLQNKYNALSDTDSDEENYPPKKNDTKKAATDRPKETETHKPPKTNTVNKTNPTIPKKSTMPPIVIEGRTDNHNSLKKDLQSIVKGKYTIKYTSNSTILYLEELADHKNLLASFREAKISHHSYTSRSDKSHAFVLRGIAEGTTLEQIEEDLMQSYDIKIRDSYKMSTKNRPLFLIVTDPAITLDFLNKNIRVVENTRVIGNLAGGENLSNIRNIKIEKNDPFTVFYKTSYSHVDFSEMTVKTVRGRSNIALTLEPAYKSKIKIEESAARRMQLHFW
ncbi:unnamed protein product [Psylliodes chrysocephalus]|uniref:Uncharacterized protein n=1 Tax=Psylliodes chrysocephalus TaxID=3402493 RepID=A0A9P0GBE8_9CUCU|nr:unnamed protein product [Psylliodes chrysocephala]